VEAIAITSAGFLKVSILQTQDVSLQHGREKPSNKIMTWRNWRGLFEKFVEQAMGNGNAKP